MEEGSSKGESLDEGEVTQVPRYFLMMDSLSMWSGTGSFYCCHGELQSDQFHTLLWHQSCRKKVRRSWVHACQFLDKGKGGWHGRHHGLSMWEVGVGDK